MKKASIDMTPMEAFLRNFVVPTEGLEPPHLAAHGPEPCASTNSATWAFSVLLCCQHCAGVTRRRGTRQPCCCILHLVPTEGLEPPHLAAHGPEPCASTNSATWALQEHLCYNSRVCHFPPDQLFVKHSCQAHQTSSATTAFHRPGVVAVAEESEIIADHFQ